MRGDPDLGCDVVEVDLREWEVGWLEEVDGVAARSCPVGKHRCVKFVSYSGGRGRGPRRAPVEVSFFTYHGQTYPVRDVPGRLDRVLGEILGGLLEASRVNPYELFLEMIDQSLVQVERRREWRRRTG